MASFTGSAGSNAPLLPHEQLSTCTLYFFAFSISQSVACRMDRFTMLSPSPTDSPTRCAPGATPRYAPNVDAPLPATMPADARPVPAAVVRVRQVLHEQPAARPRGAVVLGGVGEVRDELDVGHGPGGMRHVRVEPVDAAVHDGHADPVRVARRHGHVRADAGHALAQQHALGAVVVHALHAVQGGERQDLRRGRQRRHQGQVLELHHLRRPARAPPRRPCPTRSAPGQSSRSPPAGPSAAPRPGRWKAPGPGGSPPATGRARPARRRCRSRSTRPPWPAARQGSSGASSSPSVRQDV